MKKIFLTLFAFIVLSCFFIGNNSCLAKSNFDFPKLDGWKTSGEVQIFLPPTLYEYINGAADLYLIYDFQELEVNEYVNEKKASVTIEIYRHSTPTLAFGVYSQERLNNADFIDVGVQGYLEDHALNFFSGPYYVKISSYKTGADDKEILLDFAKKVAENLGTKGSFPSLLVTFPQEGKLKNTEKYIAKNYLGYSFLHSAFTADYELSGKKFQIFLIDGKDKSECQEMVRKYLEQTKNLKKEISEGEYTLLDPYHGEIEFNWDGTHIWGILNMNDPIIRSTYLKSFKERLTEKQ